MAFHKKLGVIGYGNMSGAIISGMLSCSAIKPHDITVYDIDSEKLKAATLEGLCISPTISGLCGCEYILFAVKPQNAPKVYESFNSDFKNCSIISIMAGITKKAITEGTGISKVCRCMPNTPAIIKKGVTAIDTESLTTAGKDFVVCMFKSIGEVELIAESLMNAVTAVSGSGPAYVYSFIDAYIKAAIKCGLTSKQAQKLVIGTVIGATEMVKNRTDNIENLISSVCSKGGTTERAVAVLKENNLTGIFESALSAAKVRAEELSR